MSLVSGLVQRVRATWFVVKLSWHLSQFLIWFGLQQYLLGRVFLVSACWLLLALLLVTNQLLLAYFPNTFTPNLAHNLGLKPQQQENITWKLMTVSQLEKICTTLAQASSEHPTHQSLLRNTALCWLTQDKPMMAQNAWNTAQALNPNR